MLLLLLFQGLGPEDRRDEGDAHAHCADDNGHDQADGEGAQTVAPDTACAFHPEQEAGEKPLATHRDGVNELVVIGVWQSLLPFCGGAGGVLL